MVNNIRPQMPGSNLVIVNAYNIIRDILRFPTLRGKNTWQLIKSSYHLTHLINLTKSKFRSLIRVGFTNTTQPCCEVPSRALGGTGIWCRRGGSTCEDRTKFVYFDGLHPTEAVNVILARKAYGSIVTREVYPFNVWILARI